MLTGADALLALLVLLTLSLLGHSGLLVSGWNTHSLGCLIEFLSPRPVWPASHRWHESCTPARRRVDLVCTVAPEIELGLDWGRSRPERPPQRKEGLR